jgi:uncharacterized protein YabN with tetrapyrrole methylase and pyrophosphatase domain
MPDPNYDGIGPNVVPGLDEIEDIVLTTSHKNGLFDNSTVEKQFFKLAEEFGELGEALSHGNIDAIEDAIGDCTVVLTNLAHFVGLSHRECYRLCAGIYSRRVMDMVNGVLIKRTKE